MAIHHLAADRVLYAMSSENPPALRVHSGDTVVIDTVDCFENQITSEKQKLDAIDWEHINPATGPIAVEEAEPGDCLAVYVQQIVPAKTGVMATGKGMGVLGDELDHNVIRIVQLHREEGTFQLFGRRYPLNPMIGVIGVAPKTGAIPCGTPGDHGGNMDCKRIKEDTILLLPVSVPGALFALGDLHAAMGDGEVAVCGVEIAGTVTVKLKVLKGYALAGPMAVDEKQVMTIASAASLDESATLATKRMAHWVSDQTGLSVSDALLLLSAKGELHICQVVDPLKTVRMEFPKSWLEELGVSFEWL